MHARNLNLKMSFALCAVTSEAAKRDRDKGMKGIIAASERDCGGVVDVGGGQNNHRGCGGDRA